jgi:Toprim domain-containing protein
VLTADQILAEHRIARVRNKDEFSTTCPRCSASRMKRKATPLSVKIDKRGVQWNCHHCQWHGFHFYSGVQRKIETTVAVAAHDDYDRPRVARARDIWRESLDPAGTLVEEYLSGRSLRLLDDIAGRVVRYHGSLPWRDGDDRLIHVHAMVTAMRDIGTDDLRSVQCTALNRDGTKIARRVRGVATGCAIKLDADDNVTMGLGIAEGFETALVVKMKGWRPVWAVGSAHAVEAFPVLPGIECLTIFGDHDSSGQGQNAALCCAKHWIEAGRETNIRIPKDHKDWNDVLIGGVV